MPFSYHCMNKLSLEYYKQKPFQALSEFICTFKFDKCKLFSPLVTYICFNKLNGKVLLTNFVYRFVVYYLRSSNITRHLSNKQTTRLCSSLEYRSVPTTMKTTTVTIKDQNFVLIVDFNIDITDF